MFPCTTDEIIRHADVERSVASACQNVDPETHGLGLLGPRNGARDSKSAFTRVCDALCVAGCPSRDERRECTPCLTLWIGANHVFFSSAAARASTSTTFASA